MTKASIIRDLKIDVPSVTFYFEGGLRSLVTFQNHHLKPIHKNIFYVEKNRTTYRLKSLCNMSTTSPRALAFANNIYNAEGGTHVTGFKTALTRTLNATAQK